MTPVVSIIVPCFNSQDFISETFNSIEQQNFTDWECIVINDGSTDSTQDIIEGFCRKDARFRVFQIENSGVSVARNLGLSKSLGEFIQLIDSDDLIGPNKFESQVAQLRANSNLDIVYSGARYFRNNLDDLHLVGRNGLFPTIEFTESDTQLLEIVKLRNPYVTPAPLYRKAVFDKVGLYDSDLRYLEDWDFQIRCVLMGLKFQYSVFNHEIGSFIRLRSGSLMDNRAEVLRSKEILFGKYPQLFDKLSLKRNSGLLKRTLKFLRKKF